jgi:superfamily II DNA or RNA helicase
MKKAIVSDRIYLKASKELQDILNEELTYVIPSYNPDQPPTIIKNIGRISKDLVSIPSGRMDLVPDDYEIIDKKLSVPVDMPEFKFELRPSQQKIYDKVNDSTIINAPPSWGKTFTALAIVKKLGQKTLVVTHTLALRNQWAEEIEKTMGFTPGIIGSGKLETHTPIVVGNVQTLNKKIPEIRDLFGTVVLDEMHHVSSPTFSKIVDKLPAKYKIGLSGTLKRKDGKHVVFNDYFGYDVHVPPKENCMVPDIHIIESDIRFPDGARTPWAKRVNTIAYDPNYQHLIAQLASVYAAKGHKVLVVSDRVALLKNCAELTGKRAICVTGEMNHELRGPELNKIKDDEADILYGTQSIFSEGISLNELSVLILGTPINNEPLLIQLIGRVVREKEGKLTPVIVDIKLKGKTASNQARSRMAVYLQEGYTVKNYS